jgi:hypothetical protein
LATGVAEMTGPAQHAGAAYFHRLEEAFVEAGEAAGGGLERDFHVGGMNLRLRFAGAELEPPLLRALRHLRPPRTGAPLATISVWDSDSTGVPVPLFPWRPGDVRRRGEIRGFNHARIRTVYHGDVMAPGFGFHALSMCDVASRSAIFWVQGRDRLPWTELAEPLRTALNWTLSGPTLHLVHAACVSTGDGGVLLAGKGGSGKTTTALACLEAGFGFSGDNYVALSTVGRPMAHSLFGNAKLRPEGLALLPGFAHDIEGLGEDGEDKLVVDVACRRPGLLKHEVPIEALVVPRIVPGARTRIRPGSPGEGLLTLAPTTMFQLPGDGRPAFRTMTEFVRRVPTYVLELGGETADAPPAIAGILQALRRGRRAG